MSDPLFLRTPPHTPGRGHEAPSIFMLAPQGNVKEGNTFIRKQFKRLMQQKYLGNHEAYWSICLKLLSESKIFFLVSLYKWNPIFYKTVNIKKLIKILRDFKSCCHTQKD